MKPETLTGLIVALNAVAGVALLVWMAVAEYGLSKERRASPPREAEPPRKRLVKTPRRTYANPVPEGSVPIGPNMRIAPFSESDLKFLRSLREKEQRDGTVTDEAD